MALTEPPYTARFANFSSLCDVKLNQSLIDTLQKSLHTTTDQHRILNQQAKLYRRIGQLHHAQSTYQQLLTLNSTHTHTTNLKPSQITPTHLQSTDGYRVPPIFLIDNFLTPLVVNDLLQQAIHTKNTFIPAKIDSHQPSYNPFKRKTWVSRQLGTFKPFFLNHIMHSFPDLCDQLGIPTFDIAQLEIKMTNHLDAGFFDIHQDNNHLFGDSKRVISWLYYFHQQPRCFEGGDLLLFDTNDQTGSYKELGLTKITPTCNRFVAFPSYFYHAVTPVILASNRFEEGRFAISGHIHYTKRP